MKGFFGFENKLFLEIALTLFAMVVLFLVVWEILGGV